MEGSFKTFKEFRREHPEYDSVPDDSLFDQMHRKYYSDIPKEELAKAVDYHPPRSFGENVKELGHQIAGGYDVDLGRMVGQGIRAVSPIGSDTRQIGADIANEAYDRAKDYQYDDARSGLIWNILHKGGRALPQIAPVLGASVINPALGYATVAGMYGPSSYQDSYDRVIASIGGTEKEAKEAGLISAGIDTGLYWLVVWITLLFCKRFRLLAKTTFSAFLENGAKNRFTAPLDFRYFHSLVTLGSKGRTTNITFRTHYDNLKVARDAPDIVIRAAYRSLSQRFHPDKNPGDERATRVMALINQSYEVLSDPQRRGEHDAWIAREEAKLKNRTEQANAASIPPQWQTQQERSQTKLPSRNILAAMLLWTLKMLLRIFIAVPQLAILGLLFGGIALYEAITTPDRPPPAGPKPYQASPAPVRPEYVRPRTAPNGQPWPVSAGYVKGYQLLHADGLSTVTVDNSRNDSDVFVKLVSLDSAQAYPIRQFYIPAFGSFNLNNVTAGSYDIRYRDLGNGGLSRSEAFNLQEILTYNGTQFSNITMTLYKVQNGNMRTYGLSETEF